METKAFSGFGELFFQKKDFTDIDTCIADIQVSSLELESSVGDILSWLKPGGLFLAISQTSRWYNDAYIIEKNGFEIKDSLVFFSNENAGNIITIAMKPHDGTFAQNALSYKVAGFWIQGNRIGKDIVGWNGLTAKGNTWNKENCGLRKTGKPSLSVGRFPSNVVFGHAVIKSELDIQKYFKTIKNHSELFEFLCLLSKTPDGGKVIDPFMNNELICAAAYAMGRYFVGATNVLMNYTNSVQKMERLLCL